MEEIRGKESREILEQSTRYCPKPSPGTEWAKSHREEAAGQHQIPSLAYQLCLCPTVLVTETYLEVKCNADHKVPKYRQESADQVFL